MVTREGGFYFCPSGTDKEREAQRLSLAQVGTRSVEGAPGSVSLEWHRLCSLEGHQLSTSGEGGVSPLSTH